MALARLGTSAFLFAHAVCVLFACLKDFYCQGFDLVKVVGSGVPGIARDKDLKFSYFFEEMEVIHIFY